MFERLKNLLEDNRSHGKKPQSAQPFQLRPQIGETILDHPALTKAFQPSKIIQ
jgi:hypothetical protein